MMNLYPEIENQSSYVMYSYSVFGKFHCINFNLPNTEQYYSKVYLVNKFDDHNRQPIMITEAYHHWRNLPLRTITNDIESLLYKQLREFTEHCLTQGIGI